MLCLWTKYKRDDSKRAKSCCVTARVVTRESARERDQDLDLFRTVEPLVILRRILNVNHRCRYETRFCDAT